MTCPIIILNKLFLTADNPHNCSEPTKIALFVIVMNLLMHFMLMFVWYSNTLLNYMLFNLMERQTTDQAH